VYLLAADRRTLTRVTTDMGQPNDITGTPDGKTLFVADLGRGKTYRFDIQADGRLAHQKEFCALGSDGMTIDDHGNLYLTGNGVTIFDKAGKQIEHIDIKDWTANVCFGGKDRQTLFITASSTLYGIRTKVKGANAAK
jgi:gluconolactonase